MFRPCRPRLLSMMAAAACLPLHVHAATEFGDDFVPETGKNTGFGKTPAAAYTPEIRANMQALYEDKIGLFVHFGPYAQLEGWWNGKFVGCAWNMYWSRIPVGVYEEEAARKFNPQKFDAGEWVKTARDGGLRFMVVTSKHHDGFAMFKSEHPYNIHDFGSFGRDMMGELAEACRKDGMKFGFYYSQSQDWHADGGVGNTWDYPPLTDERFDRYFNSKVVPQVTELATNYGDLFMFWFDTPAGLKADKCRQLMDLLARLQPGALVNSRLGGGYGHFDSSLDHGMPPAVIKRDWLPDLKIPWQTHASIASSWGYTRGCDDAESVSDYAGWIHEIAFIVSRGGVFLLNVAPAPDGTIPPGQTACLKAIGDWLKVNGESIYGADPSPYLFPPYPITSKPNRLYLHCKDFRGGRVELDGLLTGVLSARVLSDPAKTPLKWSSEAGTLVVDVPAELACPHATVVVLETKDREARVADETLVPQPDGSLHLPFAKCEFGRTLRIGYRLDTESSFRWGEGPAQMLVWKARVDEPMGEYRVLVDQNHDSKLVIELSVNGKPVKLDARHGTGRKISSKDSGVKIRLDKPGNYQITARPAVNAAISKHYQFKGITLVPVQSSRNE
jgi:alpha-L-fucosidase